MFTQTSIAYIIKNILITNIIIQIPEENYLTCTPPLPPFFLCPSSKSPYLSRAQDEKTFSLAHSEWGHQCLAPGARPPFKSAYLWGEESRVPATWPLLLSSVLPLHHLSPPDILTFYLILSFSLPHSITNLFPSLGPSTHTPPLSMFPPLPE